MNDRETQVGEQDAETEQAEEGGLDWGRSTEDGTAWDDSEAWG